MANEENLIPANKRSLSEARENGRKGGIRSGEVRREKKLWKDEIMKRLGENDWNEIIDNLKERAKKNDKSFEVLRDTMGQKPTDNITIEETKSPIFNIEVTDNSKLEKKFKEYEANTKTD